MRNPGDMAMLQAAVNAKSHPQYLTSYGDIKEHLQEQHGKRGWIGAMAQAISGSDTRSGKEYLAARRAIERHETGQYKNWSKEYGGKIPEVGKTLPPIGRAANGGSITITVHGTQEDYKGRPDRAITVTFKGSAAYTFVNNPTYEAVWTEYEVDPDDFESGSGELTVTGVT